VVRLYLTGLSIRQVANRTGWSWGRVRARLLRAGVTRPSGLAVHLARANDLRVTTRLRSLVDGLLLGDASIEAGYHTGRLRISQSGDRQKWVPLLQTQLLELGVISRLRIKSGGEVIIHGKACLRKQSTVLTTLAYQWFLEQRQRWYPDGEKVVPQNVDLSPVSLAAWVCGDGNRVCQGYRIEFCTDGFPPINVLWLAKELKDRFGWLPTVTNRNRIQIGHQADRDTLVSLIRSLVPDCFQYKLDLRESSLKLYGHKDELAALRQQGWSIDRLADHFGMSRSGVYSALVRLGLTGYHVTKNHPGATRNGLAGIGNRRQGQNVPGTG